MNTKTLISRLTARYHNVFIDQIVETSPTFVAAIKNITLNSDFLRTTLNGDSCLSESMIIHAISQASVILFDQQPERMEQDYQLTAIKSTRFFGTVQPGDQLRLELTCDTKSTSDQAQVSALVLVQGEVICEANVTYTFTYTPTKPQIHPTASVHPTAVLGENVVVGPYSIVGEQVVIGDQTILEAHVMIEKWTEIGQDCHIYSGTVIGSKAQDVKYKGERSMVKIGDRNTIREYVTINRSTGTNTMTILGHDNLIFTSVHIGHNCQIGNHVILTNLATLGGHVVIDDHVVVGGCVGVHQFARIGRGAMIGGYSKIHSDVPPHLLCEGNPAEIRTLNVIGLRRMGIKTAALSELKSVFKTLFRSDLNTQQALDQLSETSPQSPYAQDLVAFMSKKSKRGVLKKVDQHV